MKSTRKEKIDKKRKFIRLAVILLTLFLFLFLLLNVYKTLSYNLEGYMKLDLSKIYYREDSSIIILSHGCYYFEFYTTKEQGNAIEIAYRNIETQRPLTHDIITEIMKKFRIKSKLLKIERLVNDTYYATLVLEDIFKREEIDIRPSDGVAIAIRTNTPIYVHKSLIKDVCTKKSF